ncbi:MAG TPA: transglutaminase domain-containing protein [Candidatus Sulfomarinibacteraceae bacterium]|nr:transglutaminase domain-containing protein [Candidatus Sulfomarinibacteraceae bacterium]
MTATTATAGTFEPDVSRLRRILAGPAEGWLTLVGVLLMVVALAWSIDDAQWIRGVDRLTDFLAPVGLGGVAVGFVGPKLGWGRWTTHLLGVAFAAMVLPIVGGGIVLGDEVAGWGPAALAARYRASAEILTRVWIDLAIEGRPLTSEYGHYFIGFGALVWATGQHAAYAVFGHRRALDGVIVAGLVLLANMALTQNDQLRLMVLFTVAALVLLARSHAFDERVAWLRRRIGDPAAVTALYLRGGAVFIGGAILGALLLTGTASSAPLQGLWRGAPAALVEVSQWLQRYLPLGGASRNPGFVAFGETTAIVGVWSSNNDVAFRVRLATTETDRYYWQVGAYSDFEGTAWSWGETVAVDRAADENLLAGTADDQADAPGRREVTFRITPVTFTSDLVASPQTIRSIDRDATVRVTTPDRFGATVEVDGGEAYAVTALVPVYGGEPGAINQNRLRVASREYGAGVERRYLAVPAGAIGPAARAILDEVLALSPATNPYDIARTMEVYLRDGRNFRYDANVQDEAQEVCGNLSSVECFARIRAGYCQYYASTMAILLREAGIPTRLAQGFLPGDRTGDGTEVVRNAGAHAWVQVYFPGYGWVDFDPTGGGIAALAPPPSGAPESPTPRPSFGPSTQRPDEADDLAPRRSSDAAAAGGQSPSGPVSGPFIALGVLLLIGMLALASIAWRRGPRTIHPDRAWGSLGRWAARFGFGPRPSQTVYEYAGVLGNAVPGMRPELSTVARAKVEIAYGRQVLGPDRLRAVAEAHRRLRLGLLRLAFRRGPRR